MLRYTTNAAVVKGITEDSHGKHNSPACNIIGVVLKICYNSKEGYEGRTYI